MSPEQQQQQPQQLPVVKGHEDIARGATWNKREMKRSHCCVIWRYSPSLRMLCKLDGILSTFRGVDDALEYHLLANYKRGGLGATVQAGMPLR